MRQPASQFFMMTHLPHEQTGIVVASHGRHVWVSPTLGGGRVLCYQRGKKNSVVVGDRVVWIAQHDDGVIERIEPRKNLFFRQDEWRTKSFAANIDQILFVVAAEPDFSELQLTRALIAAQDQHIPSAIFLNKKDIEKAFESANQRMEKYVHMGYAVFTGSLAKTGVPQDLLESLRGKKTLILGASGMGKSTLINLLVPNANAVTNEISRALNTGKHTTTHTTLYSLDDTCSSTIIDSPGFQEFGLKHIQPEELAHLMPDIATWTKDCKFYNCTHLHEPGCGVLAAINHSASSLQLIRHQMYQTLFEELQKAQTNHGKSGR